MTLGGTQVFETQAASDPAPIAAETPASAFSHDLARLRSSALLFSQGDFEVFLARIDQAPTLLGELFRQRELAFRTAGEGTGRPRDQDPFDEHYWQLFVWHAQREEIVGAYRLAWTQDVLAEQGISGLYTATLFDYSDKLFELIGPALELGRSFVAPAWQRSFQPLKLLWAGIAAALQTRPAVKTLFGPVSVSAELTPLSRSLIQDFLMSSRFSDAQLKHLVSPRNPLAHTSAHRDRLSVLAALGDLESLAATISSIEGKDALPVLIRQYLKLNGRFAGFNVDEDFSHVLDGLVFVNVGQIPTKVLERLHRTGGRTTTP